MHHQIMLYWHLYCSNILLTHLMMLALYLLTCPALLARKKKPALNKSRIHYANRHHYSLTKRSNVYLTLSLYNKPLHKSSRRRKKVLFFSNSPIGTTLLVSLTRSSITKFKSGVLRSGTKVTVQLFAHQSQLCSWGYLLPLTTTDFFFHWLYWGNAKVQAGEVWRRKH